MKTYTLLLVATCSSCQLETRGFSDLAGLSHGTEVTCGDSVQVLEPGVSSDIAGWSCEELDAVDSSEGTELGVVCKRGEDTLAFQFFCVADSATNQASQLTLPGGCVINLACEAA